VPVAAYEAVAAALADLGVDTTFGLLGSGNFQLVERLTTRHGVSYHWSRHETAAVTMADAWSRVTGRVGVCTVHQGPGLTNAMTGLAEATKARTPLLVIAGEVASTAVAVNQRIDQDLLARAAGARPARIVRGTTAVRDVLRAYRRALFERRPVVLSFPIDVQNEPGPTPHGTFDPGPISPPPPAAPELAAIARVVDLLVAAERPLILGGRGAVLAGAGAALQELAEPAGALLATSAPAHGLFADSPWALGISGGFASPLAQRLLPQADLVLAFGASLNDWTTRRGELIGTGARVVQIDAHAEALSDTRPDALPVLGDARLAAALLASELRRRDTSPPVEERWGLTAATLGDPGWEIPEGAGDVPLDPRALMVALDMRLPEQRTITTDAGHHQGFAPMHLRVPDGHGFVMTQAFQSVGLGVATGMGAAVARPDRPAIAVVGDGGLAMALGELDAAAAQALRLLVAVLDDGAYGAEVHHFGPMGEPTRLVEFGQRDFAGVARALGIPAVTVRSTADLDAGTFATWCRQPDGPFLLDCKVDPAFRAEWLAEAFRGGA
jgi:thiamine pyrophosphate-dependent acetolactate synthase large subunit-like protein